MNTKIPTIAFSIALSVLILVPKCRAQEANDLKWEFQETGSQASLRGLCVVNDSIVWASGTGGTVLRTVDGGENWIDVSVPDGDELDFRDVQAFDENKAVIINAGQPAVFYRTLDGGETWNKVFQHENDSSFFDAICSITSEHLIAMSDPVDDRILLVESMDSGATWTELPAERRPLKEPGEAGFAASGSNMIVDDTTGNIYLALGSAEEGKEYEQSRILVSKDKAQTWQPMLVPFKRNPSSGIFSLTCLPGDEIVIAVGGDYLNPDEGMNTVGTRLMVRSPDEMPGWAMRESPSGFRSGITHTRLSKTKLLIVTVGTNGSDFFTTSPESIGISKFSDEDLHAVKASSEGSIWASGGDGRIAKLVVDLEEK